MAYATYEVHEIVTSAVSHQWSVPEFQRGFVWKATQVRDLAESLWRAYPVGSLLIWDSRSQESVVQPKHSGDAKTPALWLVDGQQRTTALCILGGRKPYWWPVAEDWDRFLARYDIRFDIDAKEPPFFIIANAAIRKTKVNQYLKVQHLLSHNLDDDNDQKKLTQLARDVKSDGLCDGMDPMEVKSKIEKVCRIRSRQIIGVTVDNELEEVVEIFARLNSKGTRVKEADIYLGIVAARDPGWVRQNFMPFLRELEDEGFDVSPNLLFQSLAAIGAGRVRFKEVHDEFWNREQIVPAWNRCHRTWKVLVSFLSKYGISANSILPSNAALITLSAFIDKFVEFPRDKTLLWFLQALRYGRYSGSSNTSLQEDLREISTANDPLEALSKMTARIRGIDEFGAEDFMKDYGDGLFGRLLLYLLVYRRQAQDWSLNGGRIAFQESQLLRGYSPQYHHIFPKKFLEGKAEQSEIDALANIAVIDTATNIRISNQDPLDYFERYKVTPEKRQQQLIEGDVEGMTANNFSTWVRDRAGLLASESNQFFGVLASGE